MQGFASILFLFVNLGLTIGLVLGGLLLLRPILLRLLRPQQRVVLWMVGWVLAYMPQAYHATNWIRLLPITFRDLIVPRTGNTYEMPAFLPEWFGYSGEYNLALPGGTMVPVSLNGWVLLLMGAVWIVGIVVLCWRNGKEEKTLRALAEQGTPLPEDDPVFREESGRVKVDVTVRLCTGLPTSFVVRGSMVDNYQYAIYLQDDLPPERMHLVLRHEFRHIRLKHCNFKSYATIGIILYWWNPLVWLGHRYFCRDMELACDEAVFRELEAGERKEYARTLVELGSGRQLWESALSFGESDAAIRVKAAVDWKPWNWLRRGAAWCLTLLVMLFFLGGPRDLYWGEDTELYYSRYAAAQPEELADTARKIALWSGEGELPMELDQVWVEMRDIGNEGKMYVRMEDGAWYSASFVSFGRKPFLVERTAWKMPEPPGLNEALRIM